MMNIVSRSVNSNSIYNGIYLRWNSRLKKSTLLRVFFCLRTIIRREHVCIEIKSGVCYSILFGCYPPIQRIA